MSVIIQDIRDESLKRENGGEKRGDKKVLGRLLLSFAQIALRDPMNIPVSNYPQFLGFSAAVYIFPAFPKNVDSRCEA